MLLTKDQQRALKKLYEESPDGASSYLAFRRRARHNHVMGCLMIVWCRMFVGIEYDGYTHT